MGVRTRRNRPLARARLHALLSYDPASGTFTYLRDHYGATAGDIAGARIVIDGREYAAKRLAAFHQTGRWPKGEPRQHGPVVTADRLREVINYDPKTGRMTWRVDRPTAPAGSEAGSPNNLGYVYVSIDGRKYKRARLAWLYEHGVWPEHEIDHWNGIRDDDSIANLRDATRAENVHNSRSWSRHGAKGVSFDASRGRWRADIETAGKRRLLGYYATKAEAAAASEAAAEQTYGKFAPSNRRGESSQYVSAADQRLGNRLANMVLADMAAETDGLQAEAA